MKHQDIIKLQEHIMGVSILVGMVRNSLVPVDDPGSGEIDDAIAALKTIDTLFTDLLNECDLLSKKI